MQLRSSPVLMLIQLKQKLKFSLAVLQVCLQQCHVLKKFGSSVPLEGPSLPSPHHSSKHTRHLCSLYSCLSSEWKTNLAGKHLLCSDQLTTRSTAPVLRQRTPALRSGGQAALTCICQIKATREPQARYLDEVKSKLVIAL